MLAGRAAEEFVYGDVTTRAENDLEQATGIARQMVGRWGMSEKVGMMSVLPDPRREQPLSLGGDGISPATRELVEALLQTETLDAADAYRAAGVPYPAEPDLPAPDVVHHQGPRAATR
jgi:hypothetical protein